MKQLEKKICLRYESEASILESKLFHSLDKEQNVMV